MNIEAEIINYLESRVDVPVYADVPEERPESFVTVERVGGSISNHVIDTANIAVQSWADTRYNASELADRVDTAILSMPAAIGGVTRIRRDTVYNFPDPDHISGRYQGEYDVTFYNNREV
ncbi:MAG: hypothetical protein FWF33_00490 [Clostridiales bacterium]|nr:hypothetical protein [Clostridiales bacterium]